MSQSAVAPWTPSTAMGAGARVTPSVPDGSNWVTWAGGTTGASEPTWPTAEPWTVTDGTVLWTIGSSWRQAVSAGLYALLTGFRDANPTLVKGVAPARPRSMGMFDLPGVYIDGGDERITYAAGIRTRHLATSVTAVTYIPDNAEAQAAMDALIDGLIDLFTHGHTAAGGARLVQATSVAQVGVMDGDTAYLGYRFPFDNVIAEGRQ